jgi:hypothetical protein
MLDARYSILPPTQIPFDSAEGFAQGRLTFAEGFSG